MIYAVLKENNKENDYLFNSWEALNTATFSPAIDHICAIELGNLTGKTYREKKECIKNKAIEYSNNQYGGLSYDEIARIESYFERYGRRYGLIKEFKENCIC